MQLALVRPPATEPRDPMGHLRDYQRASVLGVETSLGRADSALLVLATGLGKCLGRGTGVMLSDGRVVPVEDVRVGHRLMGPDGRPRNVLSTTRGTGPLYRIVPVKGDPWICNDAHVLTLKHTVTGDVVDIALPDYLRKDRTFRHVMKQFAVPVEAFENGRTELSVDPYFLGVWLGDGRKDLSQGVQVSKPDVEIRNACESMATSWGLALRVDNYKSCPTYRIVTEGRRNPLKDEMVSLMDGTPRVPPVYLTAARHHRLALLAGFLDTDGYATGGGCEFVQKSKDIAQGMVFVARSLGLKAVVSTKTVGHGDYVRVFLSGDFSEVPFRIKRKKPEARRINKDPLRTGISVEPFGDGEYFGFTLDGDGRFLLGDFTVTHNTETAIAVGARHLAANPEGQVAVLAGRQGLVTQFAERIKRTTGEEAEIEMGAIRSLHSRWIVCSKDSLHAGRLKGIPHLKPSLVIVDEAHHAAADSYKKVLEHFGTKTLGLTATPDRADEKALGAVFDEVAYQYEIDDGIRDGWLVPIKVFRCVVDSLDFSSVKTTAGDFNQAELDALMKVEQVAHKTVQVALQHGAEKARGLVFTTSIENADLLTEVFNHYAPKSAVSVDSRKKPEDNARAFAAHKSGDAKWMVNVGMYTEGMDDPAIDFIVMARPTKSRALYAQCLGRGTRTLPGTVTPAMSTAERLEAIAASAKPCAVVLDISGTAGRHKLVGPEDVLGGKYPESLIAKAKRKIAASGKVVNVEMALDYLRRQAEIAKRQKIRDAAKVMAKVGSRLEAVDPFTTLGVDAPNSWGEPNRYGFKRPTPRMVEVLRKIGIEPTSKLSHREASALLTEMSRRREQGLATFKQLRTLRRAGIVDCAKWSFIKASRTIDELAKAGWRMSADRVRELEATVRDME